MRVVTEGDLHDEPMLLLADGHCLRGQALAACGRVAAEEAGIDDFRAASLETICQLVAAGFGCTLLPALAAHPPRGPEPSFVVRPLRSRSASRRIGLVWRRGFPKAQDLALLGDLVRNNLPSGTHPVSIQDGALGARN
jgi:LysR family hydrogen peroxide-inducible transcriptional activator